MSNGDREWLADLKVALRNAHRWERVATSRDMALILEQKYISHTMDMLIGERAQVLIGSGVRLCLKLLLSWKLTTRSTPVLQHDI